MTKKNKILNILNYISDIHHELYGQVYNNFEVSNKYNYNNYRDISKELLSSYIEKEIICGSDIKINKFYKLLVLNELHPYIYMSLRMIIISPRSYFNYRKKNFQIVLVDDYNHDEYNTKYNTKYVNIPNGISDGQDNICEADLECILYSNDYIKDNEIIPGTYNKGFYLKQIYIDLIFNKLNKVEIIKKYKLNGSVFYKQIKIFNSYLSEVLEKIIKEDNDKLME